MKRKLIQQLLLFFIFTILLNSSYAQDYKRWDLPEGAKLRLGKGYVNQLFFSSDGNRLIVKGSIGFWTYDVNTGTEIDLITVNPTKILGVSPDASKYVTEDSGNIINVRNITDGRIISTLREDMEDIYNVVFNLEQNLIAAHNGNEIYIWDTNTGELNKIITLDIDTRWIDSLTFSPDSTILACINRVGENRMFQLWDVNTGSHISTLTKYAWNTENIVFTPDGTTIICKDGDSIEFWDVSTKKLTKTIRTPPFYKFVVSPDGNLLVTVGMKINYWDISTGDHKIEIGWHGWQFSNVAFSPDGTTIASGVRDELYLWDSAGSLKMSITGHTRGVSGLAVNPKGDLLVTCDWENIHQWDLIKGEYKNFIFGRGRFSAFSDITFSPDGNNYAILDYGAIQIWDTYNYTNINTIYKWYGQGQINMSTSRSGYYSYGYNSVAYSPDGQILAAGHIDRSIHLWYKGRTYIDALKGHIDGVTGIAFGPDNRTLVSGSLDQTIRLWDYVTQTNITTFTEHTAKVYSVAYNPNGRIVASGSEDNNIILWDVTTGNTNLINTEHTEGIRKLCFSVDGNTLISCGGRKDPIIQIWDVKNAELIKNINAHPLGSCKVVFSPDGRTLISTGYDGTILLWDYRILLGNEYERQQLAEDANRDGSVNLQDLIFVASQFGQPAAENAADVNRDGIINIADLLLVAAALADENGAPSINLVTNEIVSSTEIQNWLNQSSQVNTKIPIYQKGITTLEKLLTKLKPKKTVLLSNYPNPFNPETWIPYQLEESNDVTIRIYASDGHLIRTLQFLNQPAGNYLNRKNAAFWDGKNDLGEPVASGVYYYTFSAGNYTTTKQMVLRK